MSPTSCTAASSAVTAMSDHAEAAIRAAECDERDARRRIRWVNEALAPPCWCLVTGLAARWSQRLVTPS